MQRKTRAMAGEHPERHLHTRFVRILPKAFRRPDGRRPNLRALPRQITLASFTNLFVIGKSCLHFALASIAYFIKFFYFFLKCVHSDSVAVERDTHVVSDKTGALICFIMFFFHIRLTFVILSKSKQSTCKTHSASNVISRTRKKRN